MTTTLYLRNQSEIAIAARVARDQGYAITQRIIRDNDLRYVANLVSYLDGMDVAAQRILEAAIIEQIGWERDKDND